MTPAKVAHIMALVDQYAATRNAGYIGSFGNPAEARAAIEAALRDAPQAEGWVMVPKVPTPEMKRIGGIACTVGQDIAHHTYRLMIEAAPSAPTAVEPQTIVTERDPHPNAFMQVPKGTEIKAHWPSLVEPDERAEFEAWIAKDGGDLSMFGNPPHKHYKNRAVMGAWEAWQARASKGTPL